MMRNHEVPYLVGDRETHPGTGSQMRALTPMIPFCADFDRRRMRITYEVQITTKLVLVAAKQISKEDLSTMPVSDRLM